MQDPVADMLMVYEVKDLGLVDIPGVSPGVEDAVRVHREVLAVALIDPLFITPAAGLDTSGRIRREALLLPVQTVTEFR
jgi:hypothetical protein